MNTDLKKKTDKVEDNPLISIITPIYNISSKYIEKATESVVNQTYKNWEWCICEDCSTNQDTLDAINKLKEMSLPNIRIIERDKNGGICKATNTATSLAQGSILVFMDGDDELHPQALSEVVAGFKSHALDIIYSDEAMRVEDEDRTSSHKKPHFSPHYLTSCNYICHMVAVRKDLYDSVGGIREGFDGSQDHDLILRLTEKSKKVLHISKDLYYWRIHKKSYSKVEETFNVAFENGKKAVIEHYARRGFAATVEKENNTTHYKTKLAVKGNPSVSIIIPAHSSEKASLLASELVRITGYKNFNVNVVLPGPCVLPVSLTKVKFFSYMGKSSTPALINYGVQNSSSDYVVVVDESVKIDNPEWLEWLIGFAQDPLVGVVGGKIYDSNKKVHEFGLAVGHIGIAETLFHNLSADALGHMGRAQLTQNTSAVSSLLMAFSRSIYHKVGGFCEDYTKTLFDVEFCLKVKAESRFNVITPYCTATYDGDAYSKKVNDDDAGVFVLRYNYMIKLGDPYGIGSSGSSAVQQRYRRHAGLVSFIVPWYKMMPVAITSLLDQTYASIEVIVVHDGTMPDNERRFLASLSDKRLRVFQTPEVSKDWGHTPRIVGLSNVSPNSKAVVFTGVDNYHLRSFTEDLLCPFINDDRVVATYCDMVHNNVFWNIMKTKLQYARIDCGCFMVRTDVAKEIGWETSVTWEDWVFIQKVVNKYGEDRIKKVPKMLYVHN